MTDLDLPQKLLTATGISADEPNHSSDQIKPTTTDSGKRRGRKK